MPPKGSKCSKADLLAYDKTTIPSPNDAEAFKSHKVPNIKLKLDVLKDWAKKAGSKIGKKDIELYFDTLDQQKLWQLFSQKRKKSDNTQAKEIYEAISKEKGSQDPKRAMLISAVFESDSDAWEECAVSVAKKLVIDRKRSKTGVWMYKGELEGKVGKNKMLSGSSRKRSLSTGRTSKMTRTGSTSRTKTSSPVCFVESWL